MFSRPWIKLKRIADISAEIGFGRISASTPGTTSFCCSGSTKL
ncbi:Uncharacterised protein [Vibrio cholerae]|nr:Uncharacterised protein [Vibrio cholerae]CSI60388.1 Uncharacterised protein [Vibrio cholerae]